MAPIPPEQIWRSAGEGTRVHVRVRMRTWAGTCEPREVGKRWGVSDHSIPREHAKPDPSCPQAETRSHLWSKLWQQCPDEYRKENYGHSYKTMCVTSWNHSANPEGTAVTNRSSKLPFLREGLPWDRTFWRISPWLKHRYHVSPFILMSGTQNWGFPEISHPSMTPVCMYWD